MSNVDLSHALQARGALLNGHFRLSSGRHSDQFVQKFRILEHPPLVERVARAIVAALPRDARTTIVVSAAVGGIVLGFEVARILDVDAIFVEKEAGTATLRRGFTLDRNARVLVVEDVVTTGLSVREVIDVVRGSGATVVAAAVIVRRAPIEFDVPTIALLELPIDSFEPEACPQCRAGVALQEPGSRFAR